MARGVALQLIERGQLPSDRLLSSEVPSKVQRAFDARRENSSGGNHFEQAMSECDFTELVLACLCAEFIRVGIVEAGSLSWRMAAHCS